MRLHTETTRVFCPYCSEPVEIVVDPSVAAQEYIEDCFVCCRPMILTVHCDDAGVHTDARAEDQT